MGGCRTIFKFCINIVYTKFQLQRNFSFKIKCQYYKVSTKEVANTMACAIIGSRLDYCNSMFYKISDKNFNKLQRIQNRAARIVSGVGRRQQNARQLCHWLPVYSRTDFKLATLCFKSHIMRQPDYLAVTLDRYKPSRSLRSSTQHFLSVPFCTLC